MKMDDLIPQVPVWQVQQPQAMQPPDSRGPAVSPASVPSSEGGEAAWLAGSTMSGHSGEEELAAAVSTPSPLPADDRGREAEKDEENEEDEEETLPYEETARGLIWYKPTKQDIEP